MRRFCALIWALRKGFVLYVLLSPTGLGLAYAFIAPALRTARAHIIFTIAVPNSREQGLELKGPGGGRCSLCGRWSSRRPLLRKDAAAPLDLSLVYGLCRRRRRMASGF